MPFKSFEDVIIHVGKLTSSSADINPFYNELLNWIKFCDNTPASVSHFFPCAVIIDYRKSEVTYMSGSISHLVGYDKTEFLGKKGIIKFIDIINPNDFKVYSEQIFPKDMEYLKTVPFGDTINIVFSNNFRVKQSNGMSKTILMKRCFIVDEVSKMPFYELGILSDITAFKRELSITHTIERFQPGSVISFVKVLSEDYFPEMDAHILTAREKEILLNLSLGKKRKEVGAQLFISDNTVANHIKTILRKTNSQNMREAIAICKMNGII